MMNSHHLLTAWRGGLIVSCQAPADSPLAAPEIIAALALAAERNGAVGVRIDGAARIEAVRRIASVPVLGIEKSVTQNSDVYITPTFASAARVIRAGASVVALDATLRPRSGGEKIDDIIARIKLELNCLVMADIATFDEGVRAIEELGADIVGTTLAGYTPETAGLEGPDFVLVERLARRLRAPVICEGRLRHPEDLRRAFSSGAFAAVVGTAITGIDSLTKSFVEATRAANKEKGD